MVPAIENQGYPLDVNGFLRLKLVPSPEKGHVKAELYSLYANESKLLKNILPLLSIESSQGSVTPESTNFDIAVSPGDGSFALKINKNANDKPWAEFALQDGQVNLLRSYRQLFVGETQIIGRHPQTEFPLPMDYGSELPQLTVDQHTHLSAQVSSADLMKIGLEHGIYYPTSILDQLHISYPGDDRKQPENRPEHGFKDIPKLDFLPYRRKGASKETTERGIMLNDLSESSQRALQNAMGLSPETQSTIEDMEKAYFHREPFTKNHALLPDILRKIAADCKAQGIKYTELSTNAILPSSNKDGTLDLKWLKTVHDVMSADGTLDGVAIRFRPGIPRNLGNAEFMGRVEKYKRIAEDPFIAGPDILGFEMNKTSDMKKHLDELAGWMQEHQPNDSIQIHAGENGKNPANVREAIQLAKHHNVRVLVGHAIYGIDGKTLKLARELSVPTKDGKLGKLIIQLNPISNLAGNNIDYPKDIDASKFFEAGIPCLLNSDGAGFYYTDAKQNAMMGVQCGLTPDNFRAIRDTEDRYIEEQKEIFRAKSEAVQKKSFEKFVEEASAYLPLPEKDPAKAGGLPPVIPIVDKALEGMRPIAFFGAGGSGWDEMPGKQKKEFRAGFKMLLNHLDPEKTYFLKGRSKDVIVKNGVTKKASSIGKVMVDAIKEYNDAHPNQQPFFIGTLLADKESTNGHGSPGDFTKPLDTAFIGLPSAIAHELKEKKGAAIFFGGRQFSRNFIVELEKQGIPIGIMNDGLPVNVSASSSKARVFPDFTFKGAIEMVKYVHGLDALSDLFLPGRKLNGDALAEEYKRILLSKSLKPTPDTSSLQLA